MDPNRICIRLCGQFGRPDYLLYLSHSISTSYHHIFKHKHERHLQFRYYESRRHSQTPPQETTYDQSSEVVHLGSLFSDARGTREAVDGRGQEAARVCVSRSGGRGEEEEEEGVSLVVSIWIAMTPQKQSADTDTFYSCGRTFTAAKTVPAASKNSKTLNTTLRLPYSTSRGTTTSPYPSRTLPPASKRSGPKGTNCRRRSRRRAVGVVTPGTRSGVGVVRTSGCRRLSRGRRSRSRWR